MPAELHLPNSIEETVALLDRYGDGVVVLAGGTVVMRLVHDGVLIPRVAISLSRLGLDGIERANGTIRIGACTTLAHLAAFQGLPMLAAAAASIGGPALRNTATVGGNLFAHAPYGDLAVALLAHGAVVEVTGRGGPMELALEDFIAQPPRGGIVTGLRLPGEHRSTAYLKLGRRRANATAVVAAAVSVGPGGPRVALGGAFDRPHRSGAAEAVLAEGPLHSDRIAAAAQAAADEADPPSDSVATSWYRRRMVVVALRRALESLGDHE